MSIDHVDTQILKSLSGEKDPPPKNQCPVCKGNGNIAYDDTIMVCPKCKGKKVIEEAT